MSLYSSPEFKHLFAAHLRGKHMLELVFDNFCKDPNNRTAKKVVDGALEELKKQHNEGGTDSVNRADAASSSTSSEVGGNGDYGMSPKVKNGKGAGKRDTADRNLMTRLREALNNFAITPAGMSFPDRVELREVDRGTTFYTLTDVPRSLDEKFWGHGFSLVPPARLREKQRVRIVYNEMLCFRDYPENILIRSTDANRTRKFVVDQAEQTRTQECIDRLFAELKLDRKMFKATTQYLLAGEIEGRDSIRCWFQRSCRCLFNATSTDSEFVAVEDDLPSWRIEEEDLEGAHLILLGNPRTNRFIDTLQKRNKDFRYEMRTDLMRLRIRNVLPHEEEVLKNLSQYGKIGEKVDGDFCFHDDLYDGTETRKSFVIISRCPHLFDSSLGCTSIGSYSNSSIGEVARQLVCPNKARELLGRCFGDAKLPNRFQCIVKVDTEGDPHYADKPECILFQRY